LSGADQLSRYAAALEAEFPRAECSLVVLAPAAAELATEGAVRVSWEGVYRVMTESVDLADGAVPGWLLREFTTYLEEEGLKDVPLTQATVDALRVIAELESALTRIAEQAFAELSRGWPPLRKPSRAPHGLDLQTFRHALPSDALPDVAGARDARLEWGLDPTDRYPDELVFWAGLWSGAGGPLSRPENDEWITCHEARDLAVESAGKEDWLMRTLEPIDLLVHRDVATQGQALSSFVAETFEAIIASP
jgi:hypothetical protein